MKRIVLLVLVVIVIIAAYWAGLLIRSPQEKGLRHVARLTSNADIVRFANNSEYFAVRTYSPCLCLYDVKGNLLGQIDLQKNVEDFCFRSCSPYVLNNSQAQAKWMNAQYMTSNFS